MMAPGDRVRFCYGSERGTVVWVGGASGCIDVRSDDGRLRGPLPASHWERLDEPGHVGRMYAEARRLLKEARASVDDDQWACNGLEWHLRRVDALRFAIKWRRRAEREVATQKKTIEGHSMSSEDIRQTILDALSDAAKDFVAYNRKEDEELSPADLERAIDDGVITIKDLGERFGRYVAQHMGRKYDT